MGSQPCNQEHNNYAPAQFLVENIALLPRGRALDVAMGSGRNSVYLAKMGFQVEGVDRSAEAVQDALQLAAQNSVTIRAEISDLENDYQVKPETYEVVICFNYLQRSLIPQIKSGIKKGGMVVYETYIIDQTRFGRPHNPDFLLRYNELLDKFRDFRCLRYREGIFDNSQAIASIIAQKLQ
jgi:tellurite methyltransferase